MTAGIIRVRVLIEGGSYMRKITFLDLGYDMEYRNHASVVRVDVDE